MKSLPGKVVALTGAGSGLGRAIAIELARQGCSLAIADINELSLFETQQLISDLIKSKVTDNETSGKELKTNSRITTNTGIEVTGIKVTTHCLDVSNKASVAQFAKDTVSLHGCVDIIINNAGVLARTSIEDISYADFEWVINTNMWGVVYGTKAFLPYLKQRPEAHVVNISSINAMLGFPTNAPYNMSKYAVLGFSETLIQELRDTRIHVSSVHPGGVKTNIANSGRNMHESDRFTFNRFASTTSEKAARDIVSGMKRNKEKIFVGADAKVMQVMKRLFPTQSVHLIGYIASRLFLGAKV